MTTKFNIGIVGCGNICGAYSKNTQPYDWLRIIACADILTERAQAVAEKFNIPRVCSVEQIMADPDIHVILNLTVPNAHAAINQAALAAGKHVYTEKPFATNRDDARKTIELARQKKLRVGGAPDTFLGGGIQTCIKLIREGAIGRPVAATAFMAGHGMEKWHPNPDFFFQPGGGPMLDMGPYYITALVNLIGPVSSVTGMASASFAERIIGSGPRAGESIKVTTPTHITGALAFANGAIATILTSWDVWAHHLPCIEIHGTEASLTVPDPNGFGGVVQLRRADQKDWTVIPLTHNANVGRGIGLADMMRAEQTGRAHRCNGDMAGHVLDVICSIQESCATGIHIDIASDCVQPAPLPTGLAPGQLD